MWERMPLSRHTTIPCLFTCKGLNNSKGLDRTVKCTKQIWSVPISHLENKHTGHGHWVPFQLIHSKTGLRQNFKSKWVQKHQSPGSVSNNCLGMKQDPSGYQELKQRALIVTKGTKVCKLPLEARSHSFWPHSSGGKCILVTQQQYQSNNKHRPRLEASTQQPRKEGRIKTKISEATKSSRLTSVERSLGWQLW